jgi:molybdopterin-guanine dinucleotide biosynthesis protein A
MGRDKALLEVDGEPMAVRVARALREAGATDVVCVGGAGGALRALGLMTIDDAEPGAGPLGGVITALSALTVAADVAAVPGAIVVVLGCDLVRPDAAAITATVSGLVHGREHDGASPAALVAVPVVDDRRQWMHGAWRATALPVLEAAFAAGERAIHRAVPADRVADVHGVEPLSVADADAPRDLPRSAG